MKRVGWFVLLVALVGCYDTSAPIQQSYCTGRPIVGLNSKGVIDTLGIVWNNYPPFCVYKKDDDGNVILP